LKSSSRRSSTMSRNSASWQCATVKDDGGYAGAFTGRVWVWKGFIMISRFFKGHLSTSSSQMSFQIFQVPQPKLVGGLEHEFYPFSGNFIIPTD
jgi:hypothetical protein